MKTGPDGIDGRLLMLASAVIFSTGGAGIKLCGMGAWQLGCIRSLVAMATILLLLSAARRHWSWRIVPVALCYTGTLVLFVWGNKTTTAANTIFIQYSAPLWLLLASPFVRGEEARGRDIMSLLLFAGGLALILLSPERRTALSPDIVRGNVLALLSGICFAAMMLGLRILRGRGAEAAVVLGNLFVAALCGAGMLAGGEVGFTAGSPQDWLVVAFLGPFQIGAAYALFVTGLRTVAALPASLISLIEPVLNPLWVFLLFRGERPGTWVLAGAAMVLAASAVQAIPARSGPRRRFW